MADSSMRLEVAVHDATYTRHYHGRARMARRSRETVKSPVDSWRRSRRFCASTNSVTVFQLNKCSTDIGGGKSGQLAMKLEDIKKASLGALKSRWCKLLTSTVMQHD